VNPIKVLLVDDSVLARLGIQTLIEVEGDMQMVAAVDSGAKAIAIHESLAPDVVICDLRMPGLDGVATIRQLLARKPDTKVLVLSNFEDEQHVQDALDAGALGFLPKESAGAEVVAAIRAVASGREYVPENLRERLERHRASGAISGREREVLMLVANGLPNREIGAELGISDKTVETYLLRITTKLGARSRTEAVVVAIQRGIITVPRRTPG